MVEALLSGAAAAKPDHAALAYDEATVTFRELSCAADRLAAAVQARPGERVAIVAPNAPALVVGLFAAWRLGAVAVPLSARLRRFELARTLNNLGSLQKTLGPAGIAEESFVQASKILHELAAREPEVPAHRQDLAYNHFLLADLWRDTNAKKAAGHYLQSIKLRDQLAKGNTVNLPGLGTMRVVRVAEHKDMKAGTGRVLRVPAKNVVEFLSNEGLGEAANSPTAVPAETVPAFERNTLPDQTKGQKVGPTRNEGVRTK